MLRGNPFVARAAIAQRDFYGDLNLYVFGVRRGCGVVSVSDAPYLWISVDTGGKALPIGRSIRSTTGMRVVANVVRASRQFLIREGVSITFTHLDPRLGSVWHGSVRIASGSSGDALTVFSGSFAARWCGEM